MHKVTAGVLMIILSIPAAGWTGYVATIIWRWFLVPMGAPPVHVANAMGAALLLGLYRYTAPTGAGVGEDKTGTEMFFGFVGRAGLVPALVLLFAWIYTAFL
jgi:hypothetical protein